MTGIERWNGIIDGLAITMKNIHAVPDHVHREEIDMIKNIERTTPKGHR